MRNTKVILAKGIRMDKDYKNVIRYGENEALQLMITNKVVERDDCSFLRTDEPIRIQINYGTCLQANYIAFQNPDYSNKWFFAWIDEVRYIGENCTEITYTIDVWTTWYEYWTKNTKVFVKRQHVDDDRIGANTINENLNIGDVVEEKFTEISNLGENVYLAIESTYNISTLKDFTGITEITRGVSGNYVFLFPLNETEDITLGYRIININNFLEYVVDAGKIESIKNMYLIPKILGDQLNLIDRQKNGIFGITEFYEVDSSSEIASFSADIETPKSFNNIQIKNNKCYTYPYSYLLVSNNVGNKNILKYENFYPNNIVTDDFTPIFEIEMAMSVGASIRIVPRGYKNIDYNYDESIPLAKFPTCSWSGDAFTNWLTQNAVNIGSSIISAGVNIATGNVLSAAGSTANLIGQFYSASLLPSIEGGNNSGDVNYSAKKNVFALHYMRAKNENLKQIDNYFTRFGYAINDMTTPLLNSRTHWNYLEIGEYEEIGEPNNYNNISINSKDMDSINQICRNGVTIWHNHNEIGNFNLNNTIR